MPCQSTEEESFSAVLILIHQDLYTSRPSVVGVLNQLLKKHSQAEDISMGILHYSTFRKYSVERLSFVALFL